jgi:hypothetical protein
VVYSLFLYHQKNLGGPGSSRGTLERIRAGLTISGTGSGSESTALNKTIFEDCLISQGEFILGETEQTSQNPDPAERATTQESRVAEGEQRSSSTNQSYSSVWDTTPNRR